MSKTHSRDKTHQNKSEESNTSQMTNSSAPQNTKSLQSYFSFHTVLEERESRRAFGQFLKILHSDEQLEFLDQVELLKKSPVSAAIAEEIVDKYVKIGAVREINVDSQMRDTCMNSVNNVKNASSSSEVNYYLPFKEIEYQIIYQLKTDMFESFLQSDTFGKFLASVAVTKYPSVVMKSNNSSDPSSIEISSPIKVTTTTTTKSISSPSRLPIFANAMKKLTEDKQKRPEPRIRVIGSSSENSENLNLIIKDLYKQLVDKDKEIKVLRQQLEEHRIVPRRVDDYYHDTSGTDGTIKPIESRLLPQTKPKTRSASVMLHPTSPLPNNPPVPPPKRSSTTMMYMRQLSPNNLEAVTPAAESDTSPTNISLSVPNTRPTVIQEEPQLSPRDPYQRRSMGFSGTPLRVSLQRLSRNKFE